MKNEPPLRLIFGTSLAVVTLSLAFDKQGFTPWLSAALLNAGTGVLTSVVIIYTYDQLLSRRVEKERAEREAKALSSIGWKLRQHYRVLLDCYRSACTVQTPPRFKDVNEFLGPQYQPVLARLNIYAPSPANSAGTVAYYQYIEESFERLHQDLSTLLALAGHDLSQDVFLLVQRVLNSEFMLTARSLDALCNVQPPEFGQVPSQLFTGMKEQIDRYCAAFAQLVTAIDRICPQDLREYREADWHNATFPPGHARAS